MESEKTLSPAEVRDLKEFVETVLEACERDTDLAIEVEGLALTAAEILGMLDTPAAEDEDDEV